MLYDVKQHKYRWSWQSISQRRKNKIQYIEYFKKSTLKKIATEENEMLNALEDELTHDEILLYRSLARALIEKARKYPLLQR